MVHGKGGGETASCSACKEIFCAGQGQARQGKAIRHLAVRAYVIQ